MGYSGRHCDRIYSTVLYTHRVDPKEVYGDFGRRGRLRVFERWRIRAVGIGLLLDNGDLCLQRPRSYRFIGIGWLLHTGWDILHHLYGNPLLPFDPTSSLGCAICDPVIAAWCFAGAPSLLEII